MVFYGVLRCSTACMRAVEAPLTPPHIYHSYTHVYFDYFFFHSAKQSSETCLLFPAGIHDSRHSQHYLIILVPCNPLSLSFLWGGGYSDSDRSGSRCEEHDSRRTQPSGPERFGARSLRNQGNEARDCQGALTERNARAHRRGVGKRGARTLGALARGAGVARVLGWGTGVADGDRVREPGISGDCGISELARDEASYPMSWKMPPWCCTKWATAKPLACAVLAIW